METEDIFLHDKSLVEYREKLVSIFENKILEDFAEISKTSKQELRKRKLKKLYGEN
jgi:hypothetical protein